MKLKISTKLFDLILHNVCKIDYEESSGHLLAYIQPEYWEKAKEAAKKHVYFGHQVWGIHEDAKALGITIRLKDNTIIALTK